MISTPSGVPIEYLTPGIEDRALEVQLLVESPTLTSSGDTPMFC